MRTVVNINELADQVLEHVSSAEEAAREKTAAENAAPSLKTEIGAAFAKVAEQVRSYTPELTYTDLKELQKEALMETLQAATGPAGLGSAAANAAGNAAGSALRNASPSTISNASTGMAVGNAIMPGAGTVIGGITGAMSGKSAEATSPIGDETRKLAQELRRLAASQTTQRRHKAAQVLTAGVGLAHLLKDVS